MNKYIKYVIEFIVFMGIFIFVDSRNGQAINWVMNAVFSVLIIVAQMTIDKRKDKYNK